MLNPFLLVSPLIKHHLGGNQRPVFLDIDKTRPELLSLDKSWEIIQQEVLAALRQDSVLPSYHMLDPGQKKISAEVNPEKFWRVYVLSLFGQDNPKALQVFPQTTALIKSVPGVTQAFFSILDPGKNIPSHQGPHCGWLRYHLGLIVPKAQPPKIVVKGQPYVWKEGESVLFDESWPHEVINQSTEQRVILIVDFMRPMKQPFRFINELAITAVGLVYRFIIFRKIHKARFYQ